MYPKYLSNLVDEMVNPNNQTLRTTYQIKKSQTLGVYHPEDLEEKFLDDRPTVAVN